MHRSTESAFRDFDLARPLAQSVRDEGYTTPTPIQAQTIPPAIAGRDILGCAQTGAGKTAAFALPILHRLHTQPADKSHRGPTTPRALVLAPTRELAAQIADAFETYGRHTNLRVGVVFGGVSQRPQERSLKRGVDILVACPGRLLDLMEQGLVDLRRVQTFVLDEADRMLDMGFIQPINQIASVVPKKRQTLLFSATMPKAILGLADSLLRDPVRVSVKSAPSTAPKIEQSVYMIEKRSKQALLERLLKDRQVSRAIVFSRTKHGADKIVRKLRSAGIDGVAIHGNKNQNQRTRALDAFRSGRTRVLVATDVAARGIDVDDITHVFNFDLPSEPEAYVHRIGRTARAGASGEAIAFCAAEEREHLQAIERLTKQRIRVTPTPEDLPRPAKPTPAEHGQGQGQGQRQASPPRRNGGRRSSAGSAGGRGAARRGRRRGGR